MTGAQFRTDYPEFADTTVFPDSGVNYWLNLAGLMLNTSIGAARWGNLLDTGTELFMAHNLVLEAQAQKKAAAGGLPGVATGVVSAKSADKLSVNYDVAASSHADAAHWNLTIYGTRFISLVRVIGAGPVQIGAGGAAAPGSLSGGGGGIFFP